MIPIYDLDSTIKMARKMQSSSVNGRVDISFKLLSELANIAENYQHLTTITTPTGEKS